MNRSELKRYWSDWGKTVGQQSDTSSSPITKEIKQAMLELCNKYVVLLEVLYRDKELNQWCRDYSAYHRITEHCEFKKAIYDGFMREAYTLGLPKVLAWKPYDTYRFEATLAGTAEDLIYGICLEIRMDYASNGSLINDAIANGRLFRLIKAFLSYSAILWHEKVSRKKESPVRSTLGTINPWENGICGFSWIVNICGI